MKKSKKNTKKVTDLKPRASEKVKGGIDTVPLPERPSLRMAYPRRTIP